MVASSLNSLGSPSVILTLRLSLCCSGSCFVDLALRLLLCRLPACTTSSLLCERVVANLLAVYECCELQSQFMSVASCKAKLAVYGERRRMADSVASLKSHDGQARSWHLVTGDAQRDAEADIF